MFFNIGAGEILVIAMVALIAVGPEQLPAVLRKAGRAMSQVRSMTMGLREEFMSGLDEVSDLTDPDAWMGTGSDDDPVVPRGYAAKQRQDETATGDTEAATSDGAVEPPAGAGETAEGEPRDGEKAEDEPGDGEKAEDEPGDGEKAEDEPGDGEKAEDEPGNGEKPRDGEQAGAGDAGPAAASATGGGERSGEADDGDDAGEAEAKPIINQIAQANAMRADDVAPRSATNGVDAPEERP